MKHRSFILLAVFGLSLLISPLACGGPVIDVWFPDEDAGADCGGGGGDAGSDCDGGQGGSP